VRRDGEHSGATLASLLDPECPSADQDRRAVVRDVRAVVDLDQRAVETTPVRRPARAEWTPRPRPRSADRRARRSAAPTSPAPWQSGRSAWQGCLGRPHRMQRTKSAIGEPKRAFWVASARADETSTAEGAGRPAPHLSAVRQRQRSRPWTLRSTPASAPTIRHLRRTLTPTTNKGSPYRLASNRAETGQKRKRCGAYAEAGSARRPLQAAGAALTTAEPS
jgi:hypothetical protein